MSDKIDFKLLKKELAAKIREAYPYFLGFYLLSLIIAAFSRAWSAFFYWPAFHGVIIFFTLLFVLTFKFRFKFKWDLRYVLVKNTAAQTRQQIIKYSKFVYSKLAGLSRRTWLKIIIMAAVLVFALFKQIGVLDFLVLLYALSSVLFIIDSRYGAGAALLFLASCPVLLILKKDTLAESSAIFAYYFLVITVLTQIREIKKSSNE